MIKVKKGKCRLEKCQVEEELERAQGGEADPGLTENGGGLDLEVFQVWFLNSFLLGLLIC